MKKNITKYILLGFLSKNFNTGYEIKTLIDQKMSNFCKFSYGQIYPTLKILVKDELATVITIHQDGKLDKKEYKITDKGIETSEKWLHHPINDLPVVNNIILLKVFFHCHKDDEAIINQIESYKLLLINRLNTYYAIENTIQLEAQDNEDPLYGQLILDYERRRIEAALMWCETAKNKISN
ncbi:PadR family transcriptional regulator [Guptibacillus spartinae]|uniref:PadR family transcriptional regulator n=1 Tax=Guptibacillus spartinae TaxID=3025679 RepID=UPI00235E290F|nr:PadR family transcriptional regulator [Pseudalkalibacillus spartinae]